jgi:hypothetical protein
MLGIKNELKELKGPSQQIKFAQKWCEWAFTQKRDL